MFGSDKNAQDTLKQLLSAVERIEQRLDGLDQRLNMLAQRDVHWGLVFATQQLENRQILSDRLGVSNGWLPPTRGWAASPDFLMVVARLVDEVQPTNVVECGSGVSTITLARLLAGQSDCNIVSFDHNEAFANQTAALLQERGLPDGTGLTIAAAPHVEHVIGGETFLWYQTEGVPLPEQIDLLLVDGPIVSSDNMLARYPALPLLHDRLSDKAVIVLDDANRPGEQATLKRWLDEFPAWTCEMVGTEKGTAILRRK